jgi:hypothetical protein
MQAKGRNPNQSQTGLWARPGHVERSELGRLRKTQIRAQETREHAGMT